MVKPNKKFSLPFAKIDDVKNIIKKMKSSNSLGHDMTSIKIYKKINDRISPHITHLLNSIINTAIYLEVLKLSLVGPQLKPDKNTSLIDSYRPINHLCTLEKIIEQYIKQHLESHLDQNNIIHNNHHGSRKNHATNTATCQITHELNMRYEANLFTAVVQTDLSSAFDTISASKLLDKMNYYGIEGNELSLFKSLLTDRRQFVSIDTFRSEIINCPPCSVIKGSKISATLYSLFVNEITVLNYLINTEIGNKLINHSHQTFSDISQITICYVDDATAIISCKDINILKNYIDNYYKLLEAFYNINHLKLNSDKTKFMII